jgi:hypothetical protein
MLLHNGKQLGDAIKDFVLNAESIKIFVPFIKLESLKSLINKRRGPCEVVTRWNVDDLLRGSSDLEVYEYLRSEGIPLYVNSRLHLKAYVDARRCLITSANVSSRALNIPAVTNYNYEIGYIVQKITNQDLIHFERLKSESVLVDDYYYDALSKIVADNISSKDSPIESNVNLNLAIARDFSIYSLPMTFDVKRLYEYYEGNLENAVGMEFYCAVHDLALYALDLGLSKKSFYERLKEHFFIHPFIEAFLKEIDAQNGGIYFGRAKEWIQKNCTNVPIPRRWEITENIQILYNWIVNLGDGRYAVDVPGRHSQRLYRVK